MIKLSQLVNVGLSPQEYYGSQAPGIYEYIACKYSKTTEARVYTADNLNKVNEIPQWLLKEANKSPLIGFPSYLYSNTEERYYYNMVFRSTVEKKFLTINYPSNNIPYGLQYINNPKAILVVEGIKDCIIANELLGIPCLACSGAGISKALLSILRYYTDNIILSLDADEVGVKSTYREEKRLNKLGFNVFKLEHPLDGRSIGNRIKDIGTIIELEYNKDDFYAEYYINYYKNKYNLIMNLV